MLFNLTPELVLEEHSTETKRNIKRAIEHVLRSVWESKHLITSELETIIKLKKIITCYDSLSVLTYLENNFSFLNYDSIAYSINIIVNDTPIEKVIIENKTYLNLSINFLQTSDLTNATRILCEDMSDASFFEEICKYYISKNNFGNISLKYESDHGGGNQISKVYKKNILKNNTFCLAFSDNDKRYPNCAIGNTLKNLIDIDNSSFLCKYIGLECQEIENLIPFNYLRHLQNFTHEENGIIFIENIINSPKKEYLRYFDLKKGIIKKQISSSVDYLNFSKELEAYSPINIDFTNLDNLGNTDKIIPQFGKIIPLFLENSHLLNSTQPIFLNFQEIEWNKIGSEFLFWTCARNNEPLNT
jgi:hypothetical protein